MSDAGVDFEGAIETLIPEPGNAKTMVILVDGYPQRIMSLIDSLYMAFGVGFT